MRTFDVPLPIDLLRSLRPLVASANDPTIRLRQDRLVRASWTPEGPVTLDVRRVGDRRFVAEAVGTGRSWALEQAPDLLGGADDVSTFDAARSPIVARAHRRRRDLRIVRCGLVGDVLVTTILGQRVTAGEAARAWTRIVRAWGQPAPGTSGLRLPPTAEHLAHRPYWDFHRLGVERSRAQRISGACRELPALQAVVDGALAGSRRVGGDDLVRRLQRTAGIGPWTAALVARSAAGHADTVEVGDFHVKNHLVHALTGSPRGSDQQMLELLAPFAGHRGRVVRLVSTTVPRAPRFGPGLRVVPVDRL